MTFIPFIEGLAFCLCVGMVITSVQQKNVLALSGWVFALICEIQILESMMK